MNHVHPQWQALDLETFARELAAHLQVRELKLLHAWGNLVVTDEQTVWKLARQNQRGRCETGLRATKSILDADPSFPTVTPVEIDVRTVNLPTSGTWCASAWQYQPIKTLTKERVGIESYRCLGSLLSRLHALDLAGLPAHDPLQWARARVHTLEKTQQVSALRDQLERLSHQYTHAYGTAARVSVHGDLHWGQVAENIKGELLLLDFESLALGPATADLVPSAGWLKRTGEPSAQEFEALRIGYGEPYPSRTSEQEQLDTTIAEFSQVTWGLLFNGGAR